MLHATIEGNLFSRDFLSRLLESGSSLSHTSPDSYGLGTTKTREAIAQSWNALSGRFARFQSELQKLPATDAATTLTRREWLLPLLQELGFGRVQGAEAIQTAEKSYAISHGWNQTPIHLLGARIALDKRTPGVTGAATQAPHALVQEALNRSDAHLWGIVSNGLKLRLLRDSASIARLSYVEFDLEAIFQSEDLASFGALWLLCHASRFESNGAILEAWTQLSREEGTRALDRLRDGTQSAIETLGRGFLAHANNKTLRDNLESGALSNLDFYKYTLRIVYRMLFVLVAESKDALLLPSASDEEKALYQKYFALSKLKDRALKRRGDEHVDLWRGLKITFGAMRRGEAALAIPALGGFLFEPIPFDDCDISNRDLLAALRALGFFEDNKGQRVAVNFNLGSEELGSVYESLLELSPLLDVHARTFSFALLAGNERKTTGAYYTPEILVKSLLESALDPLIERAQKESDPEKALLSLSILDPACGSGHFLTAAARRVAHHLAYARTHGDEPTTPQKRAALRDVVSHCIYGIDLNPMAVELCKVALWMEALEPGKPLSFLDSHIRCGNALLGTTPELLEAGLPDDAFKPLEGDDKAVVASLKRINKQEREAIKGNALTGLLFDDEGAPDDEEWESLFEGNEQVPEDELSQVHAKESRYAHLREDDSFVYRKRRADAWCAAFVWKRIKDDKANAAEYVPPITTRTLATIKDRGILPLAKQQDELDRLTNLYNWFHPHLEFPVVWQKGGFDLVLGNPPWERVKLQEKEWFALRAPEIALAPNAAARKRMIDALLDDEPDTTSDLTPLNEGGTLALSPRKQLHRDFLDARRRAEGESHFARSSGRFPLCGVGDVNTYALFAESNRNFINPKGRVGCILPSGIATDDTTKNFFASISQNKQIISLFDFQTGPGLFSEIGHARFKFCLLTLTGENDSIDSKFAFFLRSEAELHDENRRFSLSPSDIALLNPNTKTCPIFRSVQDAELTKAIYKRVPVLVNESKGGEGNTWRVQFGTLFHITNDANLFEFGDLLGEEGFILEGNQWVKGEQRKLPMYESKMLHQFDHRWATYKKEGNTGDISNAEKSDPTFYSMPRVWIDEIHVHKKLLDKWKRQWLIGFRAITRTTDERTLISTALPLSATAAGPLCLLFIQESPQEFACLMASLNSFVCDYITRQKLGGAVINFFHFKQIPIIPPLTYELIPAWTEGALLRDWIAERVVELCYTAYDLTPFARDCGYDGDPFVWDTERRFELRCQLDAAFFALYGLTLEEAAYVLDTFPIVRRKDEAAHGTYRTKERILELLGEYLGS